MTLRLDVQEVSKRFGGLTAVDAVSLRVSDDTIVGLIGPNGSGKTTLLNILAGTYAPSQGAVLLDGRVVSGHGPRRCVRAGIGRTFQTTRLFPRWTVGQCMRLAAGERDRGRTTRHLSPEEIVDVLGLRGAVDRPCASLSSGDQRLAMIATALSTAPSVLLLDEPAVGMDVAEARALARAIRRARDNLGLAVVVVDHNMHFLMPLADTVTVMASGRVLASGTPAEVRANESVIASYLGS
jgi:branched-chain amino acid transport system ATP-binding protein